MNVYMRIILILLMLSCANAEELEIGLVTHHWVTKGMNEDNRLVGVHYKGIEAASFINSFGDQSYLLGGRIDLPYNFSLSGGFIDGYGSNSKWFPVRIDDTVVYGSINYTLPVTEHVGVRFRQMGKLGMISLVIVR